MAKTKTQFVCQNCGYTSAKWLGKCPECGTWDSLVEETIATEKSRSFLQTEAKVQPTTISKVAKAPVKRLATGISEFDRVLGGGLVPGNLII